MIDLEALGALVVIYLGLSAGCSQKKYNVKGFIIYI